MTRELFQAKVNRLRSVVWICLLVACVGSTPAVLSAQGPATLEAILQVHRAWPATPQSIQITGVSVKDKVSTPFEVIATRDEETHTEYGERKLIATRGMNFQDDGEKILYAPTPSGYGQLDITGLYLIAQWQQRAARLSLPQPTTFRGEPAYGIRVTNQRSQVHFGLSRVHDTADIVVHESGILLGISRLYYDDQPFRYTQTYAFSEYKETNQTFLPYRIDIHLKGRLVETIHVESYQFDVPTTPELFKPRRITR